MAGEAAAAPTLTAVYADFVSAPALIRSVDHVPASGFLLDIYQELAAELQRPLTLKSLQKADISTALLKGEADIYCRGNPAWYPQPALQWSPALFSYADLLLSRHALSVPAATRQVGTVRDYRYPDFDAAFRDGQWVRQDYDSPEALADAALQGKIDTLLMSEVEAHYLLPVRQFRQQKHGRYLLHCVYSPTLSQQERQILNSLISRQAASGAYQRLLQKYVWQLGLPDLSNP